MEVAECPACFSPASLFEPLEEETEKREDVSESKEEKNPLAYPADLRGGITCRYMDEIHEMAVSGKSISAAMATAMPMPGWDDILIMEAQRPSHAVG